VSVHSRSTLRCLIERSHQPLPLPCSRCRHSNTRRLRVSLGLKPLSATPAAPKPKPQASVLEGHATLLLLLHAQAAIAAAAHKRHYAAIFHYHCAIVTLQETKAEDKPDAEELRERLAECVQYRRSRRSDGTAYCVRHVCVCVSPMCPFSSGNLSPIIYCPTVASGRSHHTVSWC
jgi:hypothetical protein